MLSVFKPQVPNYFGFISHLRNTLIHFRPRNYQISGMLPNKYHLEIKTNNIMQIKPATKDAYNLVLTILHHNKITQSRLINKDWALKRSGWY